MTKLETSDALIAIGAPAELLIAALADENVFVRRVAARALGPLGGAEAVEPLIRVLAEPGAWTLASEAAAALGQVGDRRAVPALLAALQDGHSAVSQAAAEALERLGWSPDQGEAGAAYWAAKGRWDHCVELGAVAVRPITPRRGGSVGNRGPEASVTWRGSWSTTLRCQLALSVQRLVSNTPVPETQVTAAPSAPPSVASSPPCVFHACAYPVVSGDHKM